MRFDLEQLKTFISAAQLGSILHAADQMFISQSTVNSRIRVIEEELQSSLLERSGRGVKLTSKGELFYGYAKRMLELMDEGIGELKRIKQFSNSFRLASVTVVATYFLPDVIHTFHKVNNEVAVKVSTASTSEILEWVMNGNVELGLVRGPFQHKGVESVTLFSDPIIPVMAKDHPWNKEKSIHPEAFLHETLLTSSRDTSMWKALTDWLKDFGVTPRVGMEVDHIETMKRMIEYGFGIAFVPSMSVKAELEEGQLVRVPLNPGLRLNRDTIMIKHKSNPLSEEAEHFWEYIMFNQKVYQSQYS